MANPSIDAGHHVWPPKGLVGLLVLGLAALFSSLLIYSGTVIGFLRFPVFGASAAPVGFMALFAETTLLAGTVIAAAFIAGTVRRREPVPFMVLGTVSAITYLCCSLGFGFACYFAVTVPLVYPLLGVVVALSDCGMALVWGRVCSHRLAMRAALLVVGLATVASAIICLLYSWLPQEGMLALFFVCSAVAVVVPLAVYELHWEMPLSAKGRLAAICPTKSASMTEAAQFGASGGIRQRYRLQRAAWTFRRCSMLPGRPAWGWCALRLPWPLCARSSMKAKAPI